MAAKHSAGPWTVRTSAESSTQEVVDARGVLVAEVGDCSTEDDANARLIAAAPELLEALLNVMVMEGVWSRVGTIPEQARAAIAKATGAAA